MQSKWIRHARRGMLHTGETWEGDRRHTSLAVSEADQENVSPDVVLWGDPDHGVIVGQEVLMPDAPVQAMADSLQRTIAKPIPGSGPPRQPRRIRVRQSDIADAIRPLTESLGIQLEVADSLPFLDDVFRTLEARFGSPANQGYLDATEIPEPLVAELFAAAARFYQSRPWRVLEDADPVLLQCEDWAPPHRYAVVLGAAGEVKGLALYESWRALAQLSEVPPDAEGFEDAVWRVPGVALMFTPLRVLGPRRVAEAKKRGWELASRNAYPVIIGTGPSRESRWPTPGEARALTIALKALVPFARAMGRLSWVPETDGYFAENRRVQAGMREVEINLTYPVPPRGER